MLFNGNAVDLLTGVGYSTSHCGYCNSDGTSHTYGVFAHSLSVKSYQKLIDRGWRRSGHYLYRPNLVRSCCKLYTIKLDAHSFKAGKKDRQTLNKFNRFVLGSDWDQRVDAIIEDSNKINTDTNNQCTERPQLPRLVPINENPHKSPIFDTHKTIHLAEFQALPASIKPRHEFTLRTELASFTEEKYMLWKSYQTTVHGDEERDVTRPAFTRFLCESPLHAESSFGSFHQLYMLDSKLIALAVLDLLPGCISSVYFAYDPAFSTLGLGKISALREAAWSKDLGVDYYMGFYVPSCPKMKYKGDYQPSYLLDPGASISGNHADDWVKLEKFKQRWKQAETETTEKDDYISFISPGRSISPRESVTNLSDSSMPGISLRNQATINYEELMILDDGNVTFPNHSHHWRRNKAENQLMVEELVATMGKDIINQAIITIKDV